MLQDKATLSSASLLFHDSPHHHSHPREHVHSPPSTLYQTDRVTSTKIERTQDSQSEGERGERRRGGGEKRGWESLLEFIFGSVVAMMIQNIEKNFHSLEIVNDT
jgi:hypothetical protein